MNNIEIEKAAKRLRKRYDVEGIIDLEEIVYSMDGMISVADIPNEKEIHGGSLRVNKDGSFEIILSPFTSKNRDRFTVAHEIGHLVLHTNQSKNQHYRYGSNQAEVEANKFAGALLMPQEDYIDAVDRFVDKNGMVDLQKLANYFQVSVDAVRVRGEYLRVFQYE